MGQIEPPERATDRATEPPGTALGGAMSQLVRFLRRRERSPSSRADLVAAPPMRLARDDLRALLDATPVGMLLVDDKDCVVAANQCAARLLGRRVEDLAGCIHDILPPRVHGGEHHLVRPDGSHAPIGVEPRAVRLCGADFQLVVLSDLAERPRQEREATRQRDELAHLTRAAMLGELSGALAHELNQPLSSILTNAQAAQRLLRARTSRTPDPVLDDILADIVADDRRAGEVIQRLRKWLRKEHAGFVPLAVNDIVLDALHLIRSDLLHRGVDVHVELAGDLPKVDGDRILLQQVLLNFVINGCDAMKGLPLPRLLRVRAFEAAGDKVRVEVLDRGRGIAPSILPVMFEPFETTKSDGMGMGLAVCRTIVESHRGRVFARSLPEGGACVGFELSARTP